MQNFYFTFGCSSENGRKYVKIIATGWEVARGMMFDRYGKHWGFQYDESGFAGQVEEFGLGELEVIRGSL
jgi:hypothetical protein